MFKVWFTMSGREIGTYLSSSSALLTVNRSVTTLVTAPSEEAGKWSWKRRNNVAHCLERSALALRISTLDMLESAFRPPSDRVSALRGQGVEKISLVCFEPDAGAQSH